MKKIEPVEYFDLREVIRQDPDLKGEHGLWLFIFYNAYQDLATSRGGDSEKFRSARCFFTNPGGTFELCAEVLGEDPDVLRERTRNALERAGKLGKLGII